MAPPHDSARAQAVEARPHPLTLEDQVAQAEREFDKGDYVEVPLGALDKWVETGAFPWLETQY